MFNIFYIWKFEKNFVDGIKIFYYEILEFLYDVLF